MSQKWLLLLALCALSLTAQESNTSNFTIGVDYYYGTMLRHNKNVAHLVKDHPIGYIVSYNHKTFGEKYWQQSYNYPDWGVSFIYQDFKTEALGENFGLYGHYNFYFLKRRFMFRIGEGVAYNTNPFDLETNFKNISYGSHLVASTYLMFNYSHENIFRNIGLQAGVSFVHHSNGSFKAPNSGTNILGFNVGLKYNVDEEEKQYVTSEIDTDYSEKIRYNLLVRAGVNEGDFYNLGQSPFYVFSAFADKRLNYQSTIQLGVEFFISEFLKKEIEYRKASFPNSGLTGDEDYKRASIFVGHEFRLGKFAIPTQLGYYFYWPYKYETRAYTRVGVKHYFSDKLFGVATVKTHAFNAEAIEFGFGVRL